MSSVIQHKPTNPDSDEIDLGRLVGEVIDHKKLIVSIISIFMFASIVYALFSNPIFQADALIQVEQKQGNSILSNLSQMLPDSQPVSAPEIALLQSRMILGKTVDDLTLQAEIERNYFPIFGQGWARLSGEKPGTVDIGRIYIEKIGDDYPEIELKVINSLDFTLKVGKNILKGKVGSPIVSDGISLLVKKIDAEPGAEYKIKYISRLNAINKLQKSFIAVDQGKDTGMLDLTLTNSNPELAQLELKSITNNYLEQNIARQAAQDSKSLQFLKKQLPQVRSQLDDAEDKLSAYRKESDSVDLDLQARSALEQIVNVDNQLNQLTFREAEVSQLYTKDHPTYIALLEKRKTLEEEKLKLTKQVAKMPATQQQVLKLSRDVESGRAVYMLLLNREQELNIAKNSAIGNVRIVDDAVTETLPIKPKKIIILITGLFLGAFLSIGLVLLKTLLRRGIESPDQLEDVGVNVYASIPISEWMNKKSKALKKIKNIEQENLSFLAVEHPTDLAIEAMRSLRTSLHFAMMEAKNNILMISGASPNAGKTFVTSNLAAVLAQSDKKIIFIDTDMRKGYTHKIFGVSVKNGLSDILSGKCEIKDGVQTISAAGFDVITRGTIPPNPSELLMSNKFSDIMTWASANYDLVLLDTPPILAVTDPAVVGNYAGATLLIARFEKNTVKELLVSIKRFEQSGVEVKGCILNGVVRKASSYYSYGYNNYTYKYDN